MDMLSDVLRVMRLKGGVFLRGEFFDPWCLSVKISPQSCAPHLGETAHVIPYHFVIEGRMHVQLDGAEFEMGAGESVLFPRNDPHVMGSDLTRTPVSGDDIVERAPDGLYTISLGGNGARTRIICGFLGTEDVRGNPILSALPPALRLDVRHGSAGDWIRTTFHHAADQIAHGRRGSEALMGRMSEALFVEAIQHHLDTLSDHSCNWLAGLKDPYVSRALALLHARIADPWTTEELGRQTGLSRSALAERFGAVLGMAPMQYLASWRMHVAAQELIHSDKSLLRIAQEVGYESEASFNRAFKRAMNTPPATWRRRRR